MSESCVVPPGCLVPLIVFPVCRLAHIHPCMLHASYGFLLDNQGSDLRLNQQDYLGHRDRKHTALYTRVVGVRFEGLWR